MHPKSLTLFDDITAAIDFISLHIDSLTLEDYRSDELIRSTMKRKFSVIGEALIRLQKVDAETLSRISEYQRILGFRNRLAHGYDAKTDDALAWQVIKTSVPILRADVDSRFDFRLNRTASEQDSHP